MLLFFQQSMWGRELNHKEGPNIDVFNSWCWRRLLRILWTARISKPINPKGNKSWIFTGRTDNEPEAPIIWAPDGKSLLTGQDPDAGINWGQEEKGAKADEIDGWHYDSVDKSLSKFCEIVKDRQACNTAVHGLTKSWVGLSKRTTLLFFFFWILILIIK